MGRTGRPPIDVHERFWSKVDKTGKCWEWTAAFLNDGYGQFWHRGKTLRAHRAAWELHTGNIPEYQILHTCDNPKCVRPSHLFEGTHAENMADRTSKGRASKGPSHWRTRLTDACVRDIYSAPGSHASIAERYGIGRSNVTDIKGGRTWRHVTQA